MPWPSSHKDLTLVQVAQISMPVHFSCIQHVWEPGLAASNLFQVLTSRVMKTSPMGTKSWLSKKVTLLRKKINNCKKKIFFLKCKEKRYFHSLKKKQLSRLVHPGHAPSGARRQSIEVTVLGTLCIMSWLGVCVCVVVRCLVHSGEVLGMSFVSSLAGLLGTWRRVF